MEKLKTLSNISIEWNAACLRLEDFLRAYRVQPREHLLRLTFELLEEARLRQAQVASLSPMDATMQLAIERTQAWFSWLANPALPQSAMLAAQGRIAYFASRADQRWPQAFLNPDPPAEMLSSIRAATIQAGPALEFRSLIRKEMDYGAMENIARETWTQFSWKHVLRAFALWVAIFFIAYGAYLKFFP